MTCTEEKLDRLKEQLNLMDRVAVAYSGGVDSTLLLKLCCDVLGTGNVIALTAISVTLPQREAVEATATAHSLSVKHLVVETAEMADADFVANSPQRCYYCKHERLRMLREVAVETGAPNLIDGSNYDDLNDHRPGKRASEELGVRSPLQEARLTKEDIRYIAKQARLPNWNKPSDACLATRISYGIPITGNLLNTVDQAEMFLHSLGIGQLRLRHHGETARIEMEPPEMHLLFEEPNRRRIVTYLRELGYHHIVLDLAGYRTGSMNEGLSL